MTHLPSLFIAGVQKSGTTLLASVLSRSPDLASYKLKEPMIMSFGDLSVHPRMMSLERSRDWGEISDSEIRKRYERLSMATVGERLVDASTSYFLSQFARERISRLAGDAHFVFVLRNPIERFESALRHHYALGRIRRFDLAHALAAGLQILEMGHYRDAIRDWMSVIRADQMLFLDFDSLTADPLAAAVAAWSWLDVAQPTKHQDVSVVNPSAYPASRTLHSLLAAAGGVGFDPGVVARADGPTPRAAHGRSILLRLNLRLGRALQPTRRLTLGSDERRMLLRYYRQQNKGLDELTGLNVEVPWFRGGEFA